VRSLNFVVCRSSRRLSVHCVCLPTFSADNTNTTLHRCMAVHLYHTKLIMQLLRHVLVTVQPLIALFSAVFLQASSAHLLLRAYVTVSCARERQSWLQNWQNHIGNCLYKHVKFARPSWSWFQSHSSRCRSRFCRSREILVSVSRELVSNYLV